MTTALNSKLPVRLTALGLRNNPEFKGLLGHMIGARRHDAAAVAVYFPERGATSVWMAEEVENIEERRDTKRRIGIGDFVRSLDFPGPIVRREDVYVEGYVEAFREMEGCRRYVIRKERQFINGTYKPASGYCYPPVNGTPNSMGGVCNGVTEVIDFPGVRRDDHKTFDNPD